MNSGLPLKEIFEHQISLSFTLPLKFLDLGGIKWIVLCWICKCFCCFSFSLHVVLEFDIHADLLFGAKCLYYS